MSSKAIQREGQVVSQYDPLTDHTKTEFLARVEARQLAGLHLYAYLVYPGQQVVQVSDVYLGIVSIAARRQLERIPEVTLVVEGQQRSFGALLYSFAPAPSNDGTVVELLLLPSTFGRDEILHLADSRDVEFRLGLDTDFKLAEKHFELLGELAHRLVS